MKKTLIVANWKSHKNVSEAIEWFQRFTIPSYVKASAGRQDSGFTNKEIIICPTYTLLPDLKSYILNHRSSIKLGAQDISPFEEGAYTGEVNGRQIKEFANYVLIGHSERRKNCGDTDEIVERKISQAIKFGLIPIICVSEIAQINDKWKMINGKFLLAYEPLFSIGTGNPDTPENVKKIAKEIKEAVEDRQILYGGSVTPENVKSFTSKENIRGVLVGHASLDPQEFASIITHA